MNRIAFISILIAIQLWPPALAMAQETSGSAVASVERPLEITAPLGGDIVWQGQFIVVQWSGAKGEDNVTIRLMRGSKSIGPKKNCPDNGSCQFRIPATAMTGDYQLVISHPQGDVTSKTFFVKRAPSSAVHAAAMQLLPGREIGPAVADQKIDRGQRLSLRWEAGGEDERVTIRLMMDTVTVKVKTEVPNTGKKNFQIPRFASLGNYHFRLNGPQGELVTRPFEVKRPSWWLSALFSMF